MSPIRSTIRAAKIENSERLQRVLALLQDGQEHSTLDIIIGAGVCAVSACVAELRAGGHAITCRRAGKTRFLYRLEAAHDRQA
jgi:hypothetical protein